MKYLIIMIVFLPIMAFSQTTDNQEVSIKIEYRGNDAIGIKLLYELKQRFRESKLFKYGIVNKRGLVLSFMTTDPSKDQSDRNNLMTCYSFALYVKDPQLLRFFVAHSMGTVGGHRIIEGSIAIYNSIEQEVVRFLEEGIDLTDYGDK